MTWSRHRLDCGATVGSSDGPLNVAPGVSRLGGAIPLDGRVSWAPVVPGRLQPLNCYRIAHREWSALIDSGVALHRRQVLGSLAQTASPIGGYDTFLTRTELECTGNLGALVDAGLVARICNAGAIGPFDAFPDGIEKKVPITVIALSGAAHTEVDDKPGLFIIPALIRMLSTIWLYDSASRTLFSSDFFGHTAVRGGGESPIIDGSAADSTTLESARAHLLSKFWWLPQAHTASLSHWLTSLFDRFPIEVIAPTHGCVLVGKDVVARHLDLVLELLKTMDKPL